jgi:hypothetical protein
VYFDDIKYYPSGALMNVTYYDPKWRVPILTVDPKENYNNLTELDTYGRPMNTYKLNKNLSSNDPDARKLIKKINYHLIGQDLRIVTPNGEERFFPGQHITIAWTNSAQIGNNGVDLSYYNGTTATWSTITTKCKDMEYPWIVPTIEAIGCIIKVQNHDDTNEKSQSMGTFTISDYLKVNTPVQTDAWWTSNRNADPWNIPHSIQWNITGGTDANIHIDYFDGKAWRIIAASTPNDGSYSWNAAENPGPGSTRIRITGADNEIVRESADFLFYSNHGYIRRLLKF